jgi:hypothetical protein
MSARAGTGEWEEENVRGGANSEAHKMLCDLCALEALPRSLVGEEEER